MALPKQSVPINFGQGTDTKTDPYQLPIGTFLTLNNMVYDTPLQLKKRNGFPELPVSPNNTATALSTYQNNLLAIGTTLSQYDAQTEAWYSKGNYTALSVNVVEAVRSGNFAQIYCDVAVNGNLACVAYVNSQGNPAFTSNAALYSIIDATTGQTIFNSGQLLVLTGGVIPVLRVFSLGSYFVIIIQNASGHLGYIAINAGTLAVTTAQISTDWVGSTTTSFDGVVANNVLYLSWTNSASNGINIASLSSSLGLSGIVAADAANGGLYVSMCADASGGSPILWTMFSVAGAQNTLKAFSFSTALSVLTTPTTVITTTGNSNITGYATGGVLTVLAEDAVTKGYDTTIPNSQIDSNTLTPTTNGSPGTPGSQGVVNYQLGLASKAFFIGTTPCVWAAWQSPYQSSYFLLSLTATTSSVLSKIAYENGNGYLPYLLPSIPFPENGVAFVFPYLYKFLIEPVNKDININPTATNPFSSGGFYSQSGVNLALFTFPTGVPSLNSGPAFLMSGGMTWEYTGGVPGSLLTGFSGLVEQNFFLYPELICNPINISSTNISGYGGVSVESVALTPHVTTVLGSTTATLSMGTAYAGVLVGMTIASANIPSGTYITAVNSTIGISLSNAATLTAGPTTAAIVGTVTKSENYFYQFVYQWIDDQGHIQYSAPSIPIEVNVSIDDAVVVIQVPTLPITYKNGVNIIGYRWGTDQQEFFQFGIAPNNTAVQYVTFYDPFASAQIAGNALIYTTGGVVEDVSPPATNIMTLFDDRAWLVDAEDPNLLWFSKQIIEGTPIEMSDLLTFYVSPTIGGQGSTGPITALGYMDDKLIIFKGNGSAIYYVNGTGPDNTGSNNGYSQPIFITSPVGCSNQNSVTLTPSGLMFQASNGKGIWLLDRNLLVSYIGSPVEAFNAYTITSAVTVPNTNQVRFTTNAGAGLILVYDYFVGKWSTFSGMSSLYGINSSCIYGGLHTLLDGAGVATQEDPGNYFDYSGNPVLMNFLTGWINPAGLQSYQRSYFYFLLGQWLSQFSLTVQTFIDYYSTTAAQTDVFTPTGYTNGLPWRERIFFGQNAGNIPNHGNSNQRNSAFQISAQEAYVSGTNAGFTLSGLNLIIGVKKGYKPISASQSVG